MLAAEPELPEAGWICLRIWKDLCTEREMGFGAVGPIRESSCAAKCAREGLDRDAAAVVWAVVCRLDRDVFERVKSTADLQKGAKP